MRTRRALTRYPNRRLYDFDVSRYITLAEVRKLVTQGVMFDVQEARTKRDITREILLQVLLEMERAGRPGLSREMLLKAIRRRATRR